MSIINHFNHRYYLWYLVGYLIFPGKGKTKLVIAVPTDSSKHSIFSGKTCNEEHQKLFYGLRNYPSLSMTKQKVNITVYQYSWRKNAKMLQRPPRIGSLHIFDKNIPQHSISVFTLQIILMIIQLDCIWYQYYILPATPRAGKSCTWCVGHVFRIEDILVQKSCTYVAILNMCFDFAYLRGNYNFIVGMRLNSLIWGWQWCNVSNF